MCAANGHKVGIFSHRGIHLRAYCKICSACARINLIRELGEEAFVGAAFTTQCNSDTGI